MAGDSTQYVKNEDMWDDKIEDIAIAAAKYKVQQGLANNVKYEDPDEAVLKYALGFKKRLLNKFPFSEYQNDTRKQKEMFDWKPEEAVRFLSWGDTQEGQQAWDPHNLSKLKTYAKVQDLLWDNPANGQSWTDLPSDLLKEEGKKLGYDTYTQEGFTKFLTDLREAQTMQNRADIQKELHDHWGYVPASIAFPSMMEELENQVATGEGEYSDLLKLGALDIGVNLASFGAPGFRGYQQPKNVFRRGYNTVSNIGNKLNPASYFGGSVAPELAAIGEQGAVEAARQYGKGLVDDQLDANPKMVGASVLAGATRPSLYAFATPFSQSSGSVKAAIKGWQKAFGIGDPVVAERAEIESAWPAFEQSRRLYNTAKRAEPAIQASSTGNAQFTAEKALKEGLGYQTIKEAEEQKAANKVTNILEAFGIRPGSDDFAKADLKGVLDMYDNQMGNGVFNSKELGLLSGAAPAKYADIAGADKSSGAYNFGLGVGSLAADFGSRAEPAYHIVATRLSAPDYKTQPWYTKAGEARQAIIDEAFKKKAEEQKNTLYKDWSEGKNIPAEGTPLYEEYVTFLQTQDGSSSTSPAGSSSSMMNLVGAY